MNTKESRRWALVVVFAAAMAWMESATVAYLRIWVGRVDPFQADPLPNLAGLAPVELIREVATLVMLFAAGMLAGRSWRTRVAYALVAFGVWDILYYAFLRVILGWPRSVWDWDVLFLLPLPWWGPVLAPVSIAALMVVGGTLATQFDELARPVWPGRVAWALSLTGGMLALFVFMSDAVRAVPGGADAVRAVLPTSFNWPVFVVALALMAAPIVEMAGQIRKRRQPGRGIRAYRSASVSAGGPASSR